jgi:hypothetical protein
MGDESQPTHEVFISYSTKEKKWADAACAVLERHWIRCWVAPRDITPGTEWGAAIISGLDASKIMVVIFSTHANQSAQVRREVERAIGKGLIVQEVKNQGSFSLSTGVERKLFDYATTGQDGQAIAFSGIYEFDGEFLRVCYGIRLDPANQPAESRRPDSFIVASGGFSRNYVKFKRVGE